MARPMRRVFGCKRRRQAGSLCEDGAQVERASRRLQVFEAELQVLLVSCLR